MKKIIVAIDGFSSCGKSTIAKQLAEYANYIYVDTGAMYRAVALYVKKEQLSSETQIIDNLNKIRISFQQINNTQHTFLNGIDVEQQIRTLEIGNLASKVSVIPQVRSFLVKQQQEMGKDKGIVMDGRDIGTVVFPNAELKLFLTADATVRAQRRFDELLAKGEKPNLNSVLNDVKERDYRDTHRTESPLKQAQDAIVVDNSNMTKEEQLNKIITIFNQIVNNDCH